MKSITTYINEKLIVNKNTRAKKIEYNYFPKTKEELQDILKELIKERGNEGDFNDINTSKIIDMSKLFVEINEFKEFNGDISNWDVSNVENMEDMFTKCYLFNKPLNDWDISKVTNISGMFYNCKSFDQSLNNWNTSKVTNMIGVFCGCKLFNQPLNNWNTSKVTDMDTMFWCSESFNQDISNWNVSKVTDVNTINTIFYNCPIEEKYKPKFK